jgi:hypothetical protein
MRKVAIQTHLFVVILKYIITILIMNNIFKKSICIFSGIISICIIYKNKNNYLIQNISKIHNDESRVYTQK